MSAPGKREQSAGIAYASGPGRWVLAIAVLGSGIAFLDGTVVNVALPSIGEDFGRRDELPAVDPQRLPADARLADPARRVARRPLRPAADLRDRRRPGSPSASLLCAIAPNADALIAARLLQGVGGALLTPGSLAMIESSFRPGDRARAIGAWSGLGGVATALGPLLGGYLVEAVSWRAIFLINLPIGLFVAVMATRHVPETRDPDAHGKLDSLGAVLAALGLGGHHLRADRGARHGHDRDDPRGRGRRRARPWSRSSSRSAAAPTR